MGQEAIYCRPRTSIPDQTHRTYPYLLRDLSVECPDQVWCSDICRLFRAWSGRPSPLRFDSYVPMPKGSAYLCAVMDWHSRKVLGWAVSNTMDTGLCLKALDNAILTAGKVPEIFNTDQGSQFTSQEWTGRLTDEGIRISMDGRGRWMDNVFNERLWRSVKYEEIYLHERATIPALEAGLEAWFNRYNTWRPHQALGNRTPHEVYRPPNAADRAAGTPGQVA